MCIRLTVTNYMLFKSSKTTKVDKTNLNAEHSHIRSIALCFILSVLVSKNDLIFIYFFKLHLTREPRSNLNLLLSSSIRSPRAICLVFIALYNTEVIFNISFTA